MTTTTIRCTACRVEIDPLEVFPGGLCLGHYAQQQDGEDMPTAEEVVAMFRTPKIFGQRIQGGKKR